MLNYRVFSAIFIALVSYYFPELLKSPIETPENKVNPVYDFIIIGAGSAGSVLARRLSEVKAWRILLIEAGGDETTDTKTPLMFPLLRYTYLDWNYTTVPQENACLVDDGICVYRRGFVMGGCSSVNALIYSRGNRLDYDDWEKDGATGWNYNNVLPYFLKSENVQIPELYDSPYHRQGGLFSVQYPLYERSFTQDIIRAGEEIGLINRDYNGEIQTSIAKSQLTINGPLRWSISAAYLIDLNHPNLHIIKNAKVTKLVVDSKTKSASGVFVRHNGKTRYIKAVKELILSAGAVNSPQLLMLAGIGPKDHLAELNISLVADLPVGKNLQDHILIRLPFKLQNYTTLNPDFHFNVENSLEFTRNKTGILSTNGVPNVAFLNTEDLNVDPPDIQYHFYETSPNSEDVISVLVTVLKPVSVGSIRLNTTNPDDAPLIDPNFNAEKKDLNIGVAGLKLAVKLMETRAMEIYSPEISEPDVEYCAPNRSDLTDFLTCIAKAYSRTIYHPCGTCKMGSAKSPTSVVDTELRVLGIKNLRVVDASVMPSVTRGNTNAPTVMTAEKASDMIKSYYGIRI